MNREGLLEVLRIYEMEEELQDIYHASMSENVVVSVSRLLMM